MSIRHFAAFFHPRSVALIGASERARSVGATVLRNLRGAGFGGTLYAVNPNHAHVDSMECYARVRDLPEVPDLAVICTAPERIPDLITELGECGTRAAIILSAGLGSARCADGRSVKQAVLDNAKPYLLRILGPNCVGLLVPGIGLNASFAHINALPGRLAFLSQSGAMVTGVLDWATSRGIGFSAFVSLGDSADADVGDMLDHFARDPGTDAILMYIEEVRHARKFLSAARAAARAKPLIVVKAGRVPEAAHAVSSHTGALAGQDQVYDAVFRRAGMLRVLSTDALFSAVETLARARPLGGERLAILTNGGGPGVMALDALVSEGGRLAELSEATLAALDGVLPPTWPRANPVDIIGDAPPKRYADALRILLAAPEVDAVLFIHAPTAIVPSSEIAAELAPLIRRSGRNVLACWLGADAVAQARQQFTALGIPTYGTPEDAVSGFLHMVHHRQNQALLMEAPPAEPDAVAPDRALASAILRGAREAGRSMLSEPESKALLAAYRIAVVPTQLARDEDAVAGCVAALGAPVALKIVSPDISHKSDVGGVALDLPDAEAACAAARAMRERVARQCPSARLTGFSVQPMIRRPLAQELIVGLATDPVFGPVILFGQGGTAVELTADRSLSLPPLNAMLAQQAIGQTRIARLLAGYRGRPPANTAQIAQVLQRLSQMAIELPEILELDINPLLADHEGVLALDARIRIGAVDGDGEARLAIRPYPRALERTMAWGEQTLHIRPIRPEDGAAHVRFFAALAPEDIRTRMFAPMQALSPAQLARFTQIDYDREMAFIATLVQPDGSADTLGVARAVADPDNIEAEFSVIVRSDLKHHGLGRRLMQALIDYCRQRGTERLSGIVLHDNPAMLGLARSLGFHTVPDTDPSTVQVRLMLGDAR